MYKLLSTSFISIHPLWRSACRPALYLRHYPSTCSYVESIYRLQNKTPFKEYHWVTSFIRRRCTRKLTGFFQPGCCSFCAKHNGFPGEKSMLSIDLRKEDGCVFVRCTFGCEDCIVELHRGWAYGVLLASIITCQSKQKNRYVSEEFLPERVIISNDIILMVVFIVAIYIHVYNTQVCLIWSYTCVCV